jgi:hypothetical protein
LSSPCYTGHWLNAITLINTVSMANITMYDADCMSTTAIAQADDHCANDMQRMHGFQDHSVAWSDQGVLQGVRSQRQLHQEIDAAQLRA